MQKNKENILLKSFDDYSSYSCAKHKYIYLEVLSERVLDYKNSYVIFLNKNSEKINNFLNINKNKPSIKVNTKNKELVRLLVFLQSGTNLLDDDNDIKKDEFKKYQQIESSNIPQWIEFLDNAETNFPGIKELNNKLQFIISFYNSINVRMKYFDKVFIEIKKSKQKNVFDSSYKKVTKTSKDIDYGYAPLLF